LNIGVHSGAPGRRLRSAVQARPRSRPRTPAALAVSPASGVRGCLHMSPVATAQARRSAPLAIAIAAIACAPAQAAERCAGANDVPFPEVTAAHIAALQCVVHRERERRGLRDLHRTRSLDRAATRHSSDMARNDYFDHRSVGGSTPADRARNAGYMSGASSWRVGETLAWGTGTLATPNSIVDSWLNSPGHRELLLDRRFDDFGLGIAAGAPRSGISDGATYTMLLGRRSG